AFLFALLVGGAAWEAAGREGRAAGAFGTLLFGLAALGCFNAAQVRQVNEQVAHDSKPFTNPIRAVNRVVKQHRADRHFSMRIDYADSDWVITVYDQRVTDTLFKRWIHPTDPKYIVTYRAGKAHVRANPDYRPRHPRPTAPQEAFLNRPRP